MTEKGIDMTEMRGSTDLYSLEHHSLSALCKFPVQWLFILLTLPCEASFPAETSIYGTAEWSIKGEQISYNFRFLHLHVLHVVVVLSPVRALSKLVLSNSKSSISKQNSEIIIRDARERRQRFPSGDPFPGVIIKVAKAVAELKSRDGGLFLLSEFKKLVRDGSSSDAGLYQAVARALRVTEMFDESSSVLQSMPSSIRQTEALWTEQVLLKADRGDTKAATEEFLRKYSTGPPTTTGYLISGLMKAIGLHRDSPSAHALYDRVAKNGTKLQDCYVMNSAIVMFGRCGQLADAQTVFDSITVETRDAFTYTALISAYAECEETSKMWQIVDEMTGRGILIDVVMIQTLARAAAVSKSSENAHRVYALAKTGGLTSSSVSLMNALISMFGKCGNIASARTAFDSVSHTQRTVVTWTAMIAAYADCNSVDNVCGLIDEMIAEKVTPNRITMLAVLRAVGLSQSNKDAHKAYDLVTLLNLNTDQAIMNAAVHMFGKSGDHIAARSCFDTIPAHLRDVVSWNVLLLTLSNGSDPWSIVSEMRSSNVTPDRVTILAIMKAVANSGLSVSSHRTHEFATELGFASDLQVMSASVSMFGKCNSLHAAKAVFCSIPVAKRDEVLWNAMLIACIDCDRLDELWTVLGELNSHNLTVGKKSLLYLIYAVKRIRSGEDARRVHDLVSRQNFLHDTDIIRSLILMYASCDMLEDAQVLFDSTLFANRDPSCWAALVFAHMSSGEYNPKVIDEFLDKMENVGPITVHTLLILANAAASDRNTTLGDRVVELAKKTGIQSSDLDSALISMYGKAFDTRKAEAIFAAVPLSQRTLSVYSAMIAAYSRGGRVAEGHRLRSEMLHLGLSLDNICVISLLHAYSYSVSYQQEATDLFESWAKNRTHDSHNLDVVLAYMDVLGRYGQLEEALTLYKTHEQKISSNAAQTESCLCILLGAARSYRAVEFAERVSGLINDHNITSPAPFVLLENIYTAAGRVSDAQAVRARRRDLKSVKQIGVSRVMVSGVWHPYTTHDRSADARVAEKMIEFDKRVQSECRHIGDLSWVTDPDATTEDEKRRSLFEHSERYALARGLLDVPPGEEIRISQNLRMCGDCHETIKLASKLYGRRIVLADPASYHVMEDGVCDCGDQY